MQVGKWRVRMERLRALLEGYTHARVTWDVSDEGLVHFHLHAPVYQALPKIGPFDPDQLGDSWTDDAAHAVLAGALLRNIAYKESLRTSRKNVRTNRSKVEQTG